jgi:hypothetical protein
MGKRIFVFLIWIFLLMLIIIMFLTSANAAGESCSIKTKAECDIQSGYGVMRLSALTNAHGQKSLTDNPTQYPDVLCCNFGRGSIDTACTSTTPYNNRIIKLSSLTNAHAESPYSGSYTTQVCYADLVCSKDCASAGRFAVLSLSSDTNAHIGNYSGVGSYPIKICCVRAITPTTCEIMSDSWEKTSARNGDNIRMNLGTNEHCEEQAISFEVWENDILVDDQITPNPPSITYHSATTNHGIWTAQWVDDSPNNPPEYYFKATVVGGNTATSDLDLTITKCGDGTKDVEYEDCDGSDGMSGNTCESLKLGTGTLGCTSCKYSGCSGIVLQSCGSFSTPQTCNALALNGPEAKLSAGAGINCGEDAKADRGDGCWKYYNCDCFYNSATSHCDLNQTSVNQPNCPDPGITYPDIGSCVYTENTNDDCSDDFLNYNWTAEWTWGIGQSTFCAVHPTICAQIPTGGSLHYDPNGEFVKCTNGSKIVPCPSQVKLPFFGMYQIAITCIIIAITYVILIRKRE